MITFYKIVTTLLYPFILILIFYRKILLKEDPIRYKEKIFIKSFDVKKKKFKLIWFHAASIGEFKSILPLIKTLNEKNDNLEFLITTTTVSSGNLAVLELNKFKNTTHRFFPVDVNFIMEKFLFLWRPDIIFLVDSEIWPNLILNAKKKGIPICLINARITKKTFFRWKLISKTANKIFKIFDLCLTSNLETANYLKSFGANNIYNLGNLKLTEQINVEEIQGINENFLKNNNFWCAVSTHDGEDDFFLKTHLEIKKVKKKIITVIAPRHIDRANKVKNLCDNYGLNSQILNKNEKISDDKEIIIINSYGELLIYFKFAKSVFLGKSLLKKFEETGGQSPIDAAKLGCSIYHGPYVYNFQEIYKLLDENKISRETKNPVDLANMVISNFDNNYKNQDRFSLLINNLGQQTLNGTIKKINKFLLNEKNKA